MIAAIIAVSLAASAEKGKVQETPYDFQGTSLGVHLEDWQRSHPEAKCSAGSTEWETVCSVPKPDFIKLYGSLTFDFVSLNGSAPPELYEISINAAAANQDVLYDGLVGKWGQPTSPGLQMDQWTRGGSTIRFIKLYNGVAATFTLDRLDAALIEAKRKKAASAF